MKKLRNIIGVLLVGLSAMMVSCIQDGVSTSPSDLPAFSTDTVRMGSLFTLDASPTKSVVVYNRHDRGMVISSVGFDDDEAGYFRLNVDGRSGRRFNNVEIRANDSIYIFVEATLGENGLNSPVDVISHIRFETNGVSQRLPVKVTGRDITRLRGNVRYGGGQHVLDVSKPVQVLDSLVVEADGELVVPAGGELLMHDKARVVVYGTLRIEGSADAPVSITGDRTGYVAAQIPYEIMSGQWGGIEFHEGSNGNYISHASIRNSERGIELMKLGGSVDSPALTMVNTQVRNTKGYTLRSLHSSVVAAGCEFTDASQGCVRIVGGEADLNHCTFANYYLFTALGGAAVQVAHTDVDHVDDDNADLPYLKATISNSIIYGLGAELNRESLDDTEVMLVRTLLKSRGSNDEHFVECLWDKDPLYFTERDNYKFDYRLRKSSPARGAGRGELISPLTLTDCLGNARDASAPTLGAYE